MDPRNQKPSPDAPAANVPATNAPAANAPPTAQPAADAAIEPVQPPEDAETRRRREQHLDQELDAELDDTFPASDPIPWSHEVK
jgi:hypothetical protein